MLVPVYNILLIQGFDDDYIFCGSRTQVVKQIENAIPPLLGKAIAGSVYEGAFNNKKRSILSNTVD